MIYQGFREYGGRVKIESHIYRCKPVNLSYYTSTRKRANVLIERNMTDYENLSGPEAGPRDVVDNKPVDIVDIEKLGKDLENASLLEIMDRALEKYGNVIAMAFR
ncbi:hypothetical protein Tco_0911326 [Tanacetum coccineum]|uniref:Uncharacterized protein n=1 Tax=Tanacetum coccineum TaxID=301880 RepID=A0ABQ5CYN1_9ASTR